MKKFVCLLMLVPSILFLVSCAKKNPPPVCSQAGLHSLTKQVQQAGGQFVELGNQVIVDIPTSYAFQNNSNNLLPQAKPLIKRVAQRFACYTTQAVKVEVYTGALSHPKENKALATQRAKTIRDVFLQHGVSRLVYQKSQSICNKSINCQLNRIEIVTKRLS